MANRLLEFQLRIRNAANSADALTITSVRGGTNPYLLDAPTGDGQSFDPLTGKSMAGAFSGRIVDGITSGTDRVVTSQLEDAGLRQQLMDRRAFLEYRIDGGSWLVLIAGFLTALRLVTGITYEYEVSDPTRAEHEYTAFKPNGTETIATFLARWPNRGCIFGGPVIGGFLGQIDRGGWEFQINAQDGQSTYLKFIAGYAPPKFERSTNAEECMAAANRKTDALNTRPKVLNASLTTFEQANQGHWPGVVVEVIGSGYFQPSGMPYLGADLSDGLANHLLKDIRLRGIFLCGTTLATGAATKRVRAFTAEVSEISPVYWTGHPVDLLATLWTEAGLLYNAAAITTAKNTVGADRRIALRITEPKELGSFVENVIYGPFGIGVRTNTAGELVAFSSRIFANTPPATTITSADVITGDGGAAEAAFEIDQASAVKKVVFEHEILTMSQDADDADSPDGFVSQTERIERTNGDTGAVGNRVQSYSVPGMVYSQGATKPTAVPWVNALALEIFDRYGRGLIVGGVAGLRGGSTDSMLLGDEILNNLPRLPNHNKRLGDDLSVAPRAMQVVRVTWTPRGPILKLADSGPNEQPFATVPTLTLAASATFPRTVADVTVSNAATLNVALAGLRLQMAVTTGAAPALTDYADVGAYEPGSIPTAAIPLPPLISGRKVYVRAAATKVGARFSAWSAGVSITLTAVPPVTSLVATAVAADGSTETLTWTVGDTTSVLDVFIRASGAPAADAIRIASLPPGSNRYLIEALTPGTAYTASVQGRDEATGDVSALVDVTFTTSATTFALSAPTDAAGFAGSRDPDTGAPLRDGVFGIGVVATEKPGFIEVAVATETAVSSGAYSAFVTSGTLMPSVLGDWTTWQDVAPNDGLRRQLKARHVRTGATSSAYSAIVTVTPWTPLALGPFPVAAAVELAIPQGTVSIDSNGVYGFSLDFPADALSYKYGVNTSVYPTDAATAASGTTVNLGALHTSTLNSVGTLGFGQTIFITIVPFTGASGTGTALQAIHVRGSYLTYTASKTVNYSRASFRITYALNNPGTPTYDTNSTPENPAMATIGAFIPILYMTMMIALPQGVTLLAASFDGVWNAAGTPLGSYPVAVYTATTLINTAFFSSGLGAQTKTPSLSGVVAGPLMLFAQWSGPAAGTADASQATLKDASVTYLMPDPKKTV